MQGRFTSHYLAEVFRDLFFQESTGVLELRDPRSEMIRILFDRGMVYFAHGSRPENQIRSHLIEAGLTETPGVEALVDSVPDPLHLAHKLVSGGLVNCDALAPAIRSLVRGAFQRSFSWPSGSFTFTPGKAVPGFFEPDVLFTFESILSGIESMAHFESLKDVLLGLQGKVRLGDRLFIPVDRLALRPHHGFILSRVDGSMRMEEISLVLPPEQEQESMQFLYGLAVMGVVVFDPPLGESLFSLRPVVKTHIEKSAREDQDMASIKEMFERLRGSSALEMLGLAPDAAPELIKSAFDKVRAQFRRERYSDRVQARFRKELEYIENKLAEAYLKLQVDHLEHDTNLKRQDTTMQEIRPDQLMVRREMVKSEAQTAQESNAKLSEKYFQKAREYFLEKDFHNCIQFCRLAIKFNADSAHVYVLMGEALSMNPNTKWQKMAEEAFNQACELDPWNPDYRVALGRFYEACGMNIRARKQFEKALEIQPTHESARSAMKGRAR